MAALLDSTQYTCSNLWRIAGSARGLLADPHARDSTQYTCSNLWRIAGGSAVGLLADPHARDST